MIKVDATAGRVQFRDADGQVWLSPCRAGVLLADGNRFEFSDDARPESGVDGLVVRQRFDGGPELRWHFQPRADEGALGLWLAVHNPTGDPFTVTRMDVLAAVWEPLVLPEHDHWRAHCDRFGIGFVSAGARSCHIAKGFNAYQACSVVLSPGGTLPSELLWLVLDQPVDMRERSFAAAIAREAQ